jgi:hypothetical protein
MYASGPHACLLRARNDKIQFNSVLDCNTTFKREHRASFRRSKNSPSFASGLLFSLNSASFRSNFGKSDKKADMASKEVF